MPIRVAIVEDDPRVRACLTALLEGSDGFECIAVWNSAEEALTRLPEMDADVVLMDIVLPSMSGIECVRRLKALSPGLLVLMLTSYDDDDLLYGSLAAGANGYLLKQMQPTELLDAITEAVRGGAPLAPSVARQLVASFHPKLPPVLGWIDGLSQREQQILDYLTRGYYYKEIAELLGLSFETVHSYVRHIHTKLNGRGNPETFTGEDA
jgi:DNA-binding NarL/FixJ family response regulator